MIIVKVELHSAITGNVTEIGRMEIINDGTGTKERGNYIVNLMRRGTKKNILKTGKVLDHSRLSLSIWKLLKKAMDSVNIK